MTSPLPRYLGAAVCARLADEGARVAILLLALARTGRPSVGGLLVAALMVPHVAAAPAAGAAADLVRRRKAVYVTAFLAYASCLLAAAPLIGRSVPAAAIVLIVAGCAAPLLLGGLTSLLGELAPDRRERAFALDATSYGAAGIAGPALAAVIAGFAGAAWSLAALAGLVVLGSLVLLTLPLPARPAPARPPRPSALLAAVPVMWRRRPLGAVTAATALNQAGMGALPLVAALLAAHAHRAALTGVILSVTAAGGLTGSLLCARFPIRRRRPEKVLLACLATTTAPVVAVALLPVGWAPLPFFALAGLLSGPLNVALFAVRDRESPTEMRTQVFTLGAGVKVTGAAAGAAVAGLVAGHGVVALVLGIAACQTIGAAAGAAILSGGPRHSRDGGSGGVSLAKLNTLRPDARRCSDEL